MRKKTNIRKNRSDKPEDKAGDKPKKLFFDL
jgi:hypothetical protein